MRVNEHVVARVTEDMIQGATEEVGADEDTTRVLLRRSTGGDSRRCRGAVQLSGDVGVRLDHVRGEIGR
jgi:hypothetical protein